MDFIQATVVGRLTRDPEVKPTQSGGYWARLTVAANYKYKNGDGQPAEEKLFLQCVLFGKPAEWAAEHFKGEVVLVNGRLRSRSWEKDGKRHWGTELIVEKVLFLERNGNGKGAADANPADMPDDIPF